MLGSRSGRVFDGGVEAVLPQRVFVNVRASRFREVGQCVFLFNGERFNLGIPTTIMVTRVEVTGGYRFDFGSRVIPYGGAGVGWHRYGETSQFADAAENVDERFTGYHLVGGAEYPAGAVDRRRRGSAMGDRPRCARRRSEQRLP